jgi:hypothetical protein
MTFDVKFCCRVATSFAILALLPAASAKSAPSAAEKQAAIQAALQRGDATWRQVAKDDARPTLTSRWLVSYALTLCEAHEYSERLDPLLTLARKMQDRDPHSKQWGNLRWYWRDDAVTDTNAVEFVMHDALLIDIRYREWLSIDARSKLDELLRLGVEGCLRHRVPTDYTNIAILNAGNLIVLGERLHRNDAAGEGYRRLDAICGLTAVLGVHEYCSPTYYGIDLNGLMMIQSYARNARQRKQADALLRLFWTDIAANWFPAAQRLGGCHSRSYDYLRGIGALDWHLWINGWLGSASPGGAERCEPWADQWQPPPHLAEMARRQLPRLVRQHWGMLPAESRTQMIYPDVALSCCGAAYGNQDSTLVVDLAPCKGTVPFLLGQKPGQSPRDLPRCYFIADGREDPYGKSKFETGPARHAKALHMQPFWAGAQRTSDALGLVVYRPNDVNAAEVEHVQSQFVMRRPDAIWFDGQPLTMPPGTVAKTSDVSVNGLSTLVLRYGTAAVGLKVQLAQKAGGTKAGMKLVDDGNRFNCLRLTIEHGGRDELRSAAAGQPPACAVFWLRVGSALNSDAAFQAWRTDFESAQCKTVVSDDSIEIRAAGQDGPLAISAGAPWNATGRVRIEPRPCQGVLEVDGHEVGRPLLTSVEPLSSMPSDGGPLHAIAVASGKAVYWDAAAGLVLPGMSVREDDATSAHRYVVQEPSALGEPSGIVLWSLQVEKAGSYWLWAHARSTDAKRGKFEFRVIGEAGAVTPPADWLLRSSPGEWQWKPLEIGGNGSPLHLDLPKGLVRIALQTRQTGTSIDRLMLTDDPGKRP